ncbi:ras-related protein Rab-31 isoform X2 [Sphaerodactylus townsendi]|uniref:ras-related protein Rab-31 isoform X2 n=1 Tax=Sphaerodactylus townsendi TaxID=933632 RepID=UPI0020274C5E|nr:ras-related protein Rab-31 isoform X2 [Sphaerodactylus townsendi]
MMAIRELKDTGVGKSSIVCRFVQDHFDHNISPTIGASFMTKTVPCGNELHKFLIWDTAGQERFHSLAPMYYRGSAAAVIVYDITKQDSFHTLKKWVKELKEHGPENIVMAIAGNKCDLSDIREVPMKDAKEYAESIGAIVVETSAKNAINIEELFQGITLYMHVDKCFFHHSKSHGGADVCRSHFKCLVEDAEVRARASGCNLAVLSTDPSLGNS